MDSKGFNRIKEIRIIKRLSGTEIAEKLGISAQYYYDLEKGVKRLNENLIKQLAELFEVTTDYLLGVSDKNIQNINSTLSKEAEELIKVDPELLVEMCRAIELPDEERQRIKDFAAFEIEKFLREKQRKGNGNK